jgi:Zn-dependent protease with chaperone function
MATAGESAGVLLALVTESFAVRALIGSLAAALLAALAAAGGLVRTTRARRLIVLTPVVTAGVAAIASAGEVYLPQLWIATSVSGALEVLGDLHVASTGRGVDLLFVAWAAVAAVLLSRRLVGSVAVRGLVRRKGQVVTRGPLIFVLRRLSATMGVPTPRLVLLPGCPGGAFTVGTLRPLVAVDPDLFDRLDSEETEGLLAHELSHVRRRDTALGALVGVFRDLTFFLPPIHVAARWLRREQEESADELASRHTGRPVALASGIVKVWESGVRGAPAAAACAVTGRLVTPSGLLVGGPTAGDPVKVLRARVERLMALAPNPGILRRLAEVVLAGAVLVAGTATAITVPRWIATELESPSLAFGYLAVPPAVPVESPAFATFRALAPEPAVVDTRAGGLAAFARPAEAVPAPSLPPPVSAAYLGIETQAQWRLQQPALAPAPPSSMLWRTGERAPWDVTGPSTTVTPRARPLLTLNDVGPRVGFFLVSRPGA